MPDRLSLNEGPLFPVQCFFNAISDFNFVEVIGRLLQGIGAGINDVHCTFPSDLDPWEETFVGVRFSLFEESVVVPIEQLNHFIREACHSYLASSPDKRDEIAKLLSSA
jgi:hypothetical protein